MILKASHIQTRREVEDIKENDIQRQGTLTMKGKPEKEKNQNIQVSVRCRPINSIEKKQGSYSVTECNAEKREVTVKERLGVNPNTKTFFFDHVFPPASKQMDIYKKVVTPCIDEVLMGYNCTIFAYGQTGTGKTFTMEGDRSENVVSWEEDPLAGIIPRAMFNIFEQLKTQDVEFSVRVSFLELYNEELFDLLGSTEEALRLKIYEDSTKKGSVIIQNLEEVVVRNKDEVYEILRRGSERRQTAATLMNATSSRSHTVFSVTIHIKENTCDGEELLKTGKLYLVDLAGSENIGRSGAVDKRAREAGNINQSLLTLGRVITALVEHAPHVPYRESKLTRLLQDSLGGRTKTSIIATISPASCNLEETLSTLDYAFRAKNIQNRPEVNQKLTKKALLREYNEEIERLRRDLQAAREKNGIFLAEDNYLAMQNKIQQQIDTIKEMEEKIEILIEERDKMTDLFTTTKQELEETTEELKVTTGRLVKTTETLHDTQNNLVKTTQERDEQTHLVTEHVKAEHSLYSEANQLLSTVESSVTDLKGVHEKLDRKRQVESHNEECQQNFLESMQSRIQRMQQQLNDFSAEQKSYHSTLTENSSDLLSANKKEVAALQAHLTELKTRIPVHAEMIEAHYQNILDSGFKWMDQRLEDVNSTRDTEGESHNTFMSEVFRPLMESIHATLNMSASVLQHLQATTFPQQQTSRTEAIEKHTENMRSELQYLQKMIEEHIESQESENEKIQEDIKQQEAINKAIADLLVQKNELLGKTSERILGRERKLKEVKTQFLSKMTELNEQTTTHKESAISMEVECCSANKEEVKKGLEENEKCRQHCDMVTSKVTDFQQQRQQAINKFNEEMSERVSDRKAHIRKCQEEQHESIKKMKSDWEESLEAMSNEAEEKKCRFETDLASMTETMTKQSGSMSDWSESMSHDLSTTNSNLVKFLQEELRKDIPTGLTPQRRDFSFPRALTRTEEHGVLVEQFRETYKPLVLNLSAHLDSVDEDLAAEPQALNGDILRDDVSEAGSDVSNASSTSGISTVSGRSGVSNFSRASETKENKMRVPSSKSTSRKQKVNHVNITPRGKSKLPLRSNNSGE